MLLKTRIKWVAFRQKLSAVLSGHYIPGFEPDLAVILTNAQVDASLRQRIEFLESLIAWLRIPIVPQPDPNASTQIHALRVKYLLRTLERNPLTKKQLNEIIVSVLLETDPLLLFTQVGMSRNSGFLGESLDRMQRWFLPTPYNEHDLGEVFGRLFRHSQDADWVRHLDHATLLQIQELIGPTEETNQILSLHFDKYLLLSLSVLATQLTSTALSNEVRNWDSGLKVEDSPFLKLTAFIFDLRENDHFSPEMVAKTGFSLIQDCRREMKSIYLNLQNHGVSVSIVFKMELLEETIERIEQLFRLLVQGKSQNWHTLISNLIHAQFEGQKLRGLIRKTTHLLARKIVERAGDTGEHYITRNWREYRLMLRSACGGGFLTVFTTVGKFFVGFLSPALFFEGLFLWINYAGSFLLMQFLHFTLATKQPSMTAPALAAKLRELKSEEELEPFVDEVMHITRSQFAAALGNIGMAIPVTLVLDTVYYHSIGRHILSLHYAEKTIASLNPLTSLTIPFAALTGVILWTASLAAGWADNWLVYRRLPEALALNTKLDLLFGENGGKKLGDWLKRNISGIVGNTTLGFFLAFTPILGRFFGAPLDVRHVTLSTCALTLAFCSVGLERIDLFHGGFAILGIVIIGLLNFGVSFALALIVALRARNVRGTWLGELRSRLWRRFYRRPFEFLLPKSEA